MAKRFHRGETRSLLVGIFESLKEVEGMLWADFGILEGSSVVTPTEFDATASLTLLKRIRGGVDRGAVLAERLADAVPLRDDLRAWYMLAHRYLGDAVSVAEVAVGRKEYDAAFHTARSAYTRLEGEMTLWREKLKAEVDGAIGVKVVGGKPKAWRRWPRGHKPTPEEKEECERAGEFHLAGPGKTMLRKTLADKLGVATGYVSKMKCWLRLHSKDGVVPQSKKPPADALSRIDFKGGNAKNLAFKVACDTKPSPSSDEIVQVEARIDAETEAEAELALDGVTTWEQERAQILSDQRQEALETGCPIDDEYGNPVNPEIGSKWADAPPPRRRQAE